MVLQENNRTLKNTFWLQFVARCWVCKSYF